MVPYSSPRIYIDWYTRIDQCNKVGLIDETKNGKSMGLYRRPRIRLGRIEYGLI